MPGKGKEQDRWVPAAALPRLPRPSSGWEGGLIRNPYQKSMVLGGALPVECHHSPPSLTVVVERLVAALNYEFLGQRRPAEASS